MLRFAAALVAVLALAGCGGPEIAYTEVTSPPEALPIPDDVGTADAAADDLETDTEGSKVTTGKTTATPDPAAATTDTTIVPETPETTTTDPAVTAPPVTTAPEPAAPEDTTEDTTGGAAPPGSEPEPSNDTGGATADEGLDQFCADNPGACNG